MKSSRITIVTNFTKRELPYSELIRKRILAINPSALVKILNYREPDHHQKLLQSRPDVVLTFPFTSVGLAPPYVLLKLLFGTRVVTLTTEGVIDPSAPGLEHTLKLMVGLDSYPLQLIDETLYWGTIPAKLMGDLMLKDRKLSSAERIHVVGYPRYEVSLLEIDQLPADQEKLFSKFGKEKTFLFITGFQTADYTAEDFIRAGDLGADQDIEPWLTLAMVSKLFRDGIIAQVKTLALAYPECLFVFKVHPLEKMEKYAELTSLPNVMMAPHEQEIMKLVARSACMIHYGSTSIGDCYVQKVPTILYHLKDYPHFGGWGWPDNVKMDVSELTEYFENNILKHGIQYVASPEHQRILTGFYGFSDMKSFSPTTEIAKILLSAGNGETQKLSLLDSQLYKCILKVIRDQSHARAIYSLMKQPELSFSQLKVYALVAFVWLLRVFLAPVYRLGKKFRST